MQGGSEWLIDAAGCEPRALRRLETVRDVCEMIISDLGLHVVGAPTWHQFSGAGGVTGMYLLSESHLTCHTFPESGLASFNLYCCRPRPIWSWQEQLTMHLGAEEVHVQRIDRLAAAVASTGSTFGRYGDPP